MTGGARPKRRGTYAEHRVKEQLEQRGWYVVRAWSSIGPWDLLGIAPWRDPIMVQVKSGGTGPYLRPKERRALVQLSRLAGAQAIVAWYPFDNRGAANMTWQQLLDVSTWEPWEPAP